MGTTSIVGWLGAVLALLPTIIKSVETGSTALAGPEKYLAITGIVLGTITQIGRYLQAHKLIGLNVEGIINDVNKLATPFEEGKIQSAVKADPVAPIPAGSVLNQP